jgi:hypothetical protein
LIIHMNYPKKVDVKHLFRAMMRKEELTQEEIDRDFDKFYEHIQKKTITMAGLVGFLFRYRRDWAENINELLDADKFIKEVTRNVEDSKLYAWKRDYTPEGATLLFFPEKTFWKCCIWVFFETFGLGLRIELGFDLGIQSQITFLEFIFCSIVPTGISCIVELALDFVLTSLSSPCNEPGNSGGGGGVNGGDPVDVAGGSRPDRGGGGALDAGGCVNGCDPVDVATGGGGGGGGGGGAVDVDAGGVDVATGGGGGGLAGGGGGAVDVDAGGVDVATGGGGGAVDVDAGGSGYEGGGPPSASGDNDTLSGGPWLYVALLKCSLRLTLAKSPSYLWGWNGCSLLDGGDESDIFWRGPGSGPWPVRGELCKTNDATSGNVLRGDKTTGGGRSVSDNAWSIAGEPCCCSYSNISLKTSESIVWCEIKLFFSYSDIFSQPFGNVPPTITFLFLV